MTDPISDMLARLRNAVSAKHSRVDVPASKLKAEIARILQDEGYIHGFKLVEEPIEKGGAPKYHHKNADKKNDSRHRWASSSAVSAVRNRDTVLRSTLTSSERSHPQISVAPYPLSLSVRILSA